MKYICPECKKYVNTSNSQCLNCGYQFTEQDLQKKKKYRYILFGLLLVIGIVLLTSRKFTHSLSHISYYNRMYEQSVLDAKANTVGFLQNGYETIALGWEKLKSKATNYILLYGIPGITTFVIGLIGILKTKKGK